MSTDQLSRRKSGPKRLVIVDDHELARAGLRSMLADQRGLELVGEAANGDEAIAMCRRLQPDIALIDIRMPKLNGLDTCRVIKQECPGTSVILITIHENPDYLLEALKVGAAGYLLKDITQRELLSALRQVRSGESILDKELMVRLLRRLTSETVAHGEAAPERLSSREMQVLQLLVKGQTNPEIARNLTVSVSTVKNHVEHILAKLGVSDRTQAAVHAIEFGLLHELSR